MRETLGVCEWCLPVRGTALFKQIKKCGIAAFQVDAGAYEDGVPIIFPEVQQAYLEAAADAGIDLCSAGNNSLCTYGMVYTKSSPKYDIVKEIIEKSILGVAAMKIGNLMLPSMFDGEVKDEEGFRNTAAMLKWASEFAADKGVTVSSENIMSVKDNLRLIETVNQDNFGIAFDTQNAHGFKNYCGPEMLKELVNYVNIVHIKDGLGSALGSELLGNGDSGYKESIEILKEANYTGYVISENSYKKTAFHRGSGNPFKAIEEDVRRYSESIR